MTNVTRNKIFAQAAAKLRQDFLELTTVPHNALKGGEAERLVRSFLNSHLPKRFSAGAGFILDPQDHVSKQTDVVIYDAFNCPVYRASEEAAIFPSNNVAAVIEVKSALTKDSLLDGLNKNAAVKRLAKVRSPEIGIPVLDQTFAAIFAFQSDLTLDTLCEHYRQWFRANPLGTHTDIIAVLDRGLITLVAQLAGIPGWNTMFLEGFGGDAAEGSDLGLGVQPFGEATLNAFFRLLLAHLSLFRGVVDHPGFSLGSYLPKGMMKVMYLTSITNEKDPELRKAKLEAYAARATDEFAKAPVPVDWPGA